ncbi:MAG TPA: hypothetical protein P5518_01925 [Candidatus Cloacimonas sp.]|jgi:hypothetical protein|nr:hypothetical protein [Candidatus Cloacimonas sp.]MDD2250290.1 hypothetical protein [Candidatus Cloacimonadota bacterium]MCK9157570.1 hypothetical protein [Candidatus Cloacimonas sp.]MCK9164555.1 hypothetical protein [Candidatus Cloacimonas sp.]MDD3734357.1 hypothetical protein [Candidatus Cloacimonadota bacterium]
MNEKDKELLYQTYLEGITKETQVPIIELEDIDFVLPEDVEFTFPEFQPHTEQLLGKMIVLETDEYLIDCIVVNKTIDNEYLAYKTSPFTVFASEFDIVFKTDMGKYLLETGNYFYLTEEEIKEAIELDYLQPSNLESLKQELRKEHLVDENRNTDLESPENKFLLMEYNITLGLRCRHSDPKIWVPQIEIQYRSNPANNVKMAAADMEIAKFAFRLVSTDLFKVHKYAYFADYYTLYKDDCHNLILAPDDNLIDQKAEIRCGDIVVFKGKLPKQIVLANFIPLLPKQAQDFLDITLKVIKD